MLADPKWQQWARRARKLVLQRHYYQTRCKWWRWAESRATRYSKSKDFRFVPDDEKPTTDKLMDLVQKQDFRCNLSGVKLDTTTASVDHVMPASSGGSVSITNLQVLHEEVNKMKHTMSQDDFLQWCQLISRNVGLCNCPTRKRRKPGK